MKRTSGGTYKPDEEYSYFLATSPTRHNESVNALPHENIHRHRHLLVAVNELESRSQFDHLDRLIDDGLQLFIDSGVFSLAMTHARIHSITHNEALSLAPEEVDGFEELLERYYLVAQRYKDRIWGMVEVDQGGPTVKPLTRARIEKESGIIPIPVWHPLLDGIDYYHDLVANYDRICVGNLVKANPSLRLRILTAVSELSRANPSTWHHLLGVTPSELTFALPVKGSSDSSTWLNGVRWPQGWGSKSMGKRIALFGPDYSYDQPTYYRVDGVALNEVAAEQEHVRDYQRLMREL